jgi:acyl carrier protein
MTDPDMIFHRLAEIMECEGGTPGPQTAIGAGAMNSLRTLEIITLIDEAFGVTVPSDELVACPSYGAVLALASAAVRERSDGEWRDG